MTPQPSAKRVANIIILTIGSAILAVAWLAATIAKLLI